MPTIERRELRVLILAPRGRDAEVIQTVMARDGVDGEAVRDADELVAQMGRGAGASVVCEECLSSPAFNGLSNWLAAQESWSDFPFVILLAKRAGALPKGLKSSLEAMGNAVLLEKPLSAEALASAAKSALRARKRQYQAREALGRHVAVAEELAMLNTHLEERVSERTQELGQANDRLAAEVMERERARGAVIQAQKLEALGRLTGGVAHDFNNVLSVVMTSLELIGMMAKEDSIKARARTAREACKRGAKLTGQLLAFARNQALEMRPVPVRQLFENLLALAKPILGADVELWSHVASDVDCVLGDASQLEMALLNLAINARDALEGRGRLTLQASRLEPPREKLPEGAYVRIAMSDNGSGMSPEVAAKVFDPFFTTKGVGKGTGLGLSQVYGMAEQSGGAVVVHTQPGSGTVIEIWLREARADAAGFEANSLDRPTLTGLKILVVEDDDAVRAGLVEALLTLGCDVSQAASGPDGMAALSRSKPELLLTDYMMPGMTGAELVVKAREMFPRLPALVATGYADMEDIEHSIGKGAVLRKPFELTELSAAIARAMAALPMEH
jgi:signal transduction histidine kinase